MMNVGYMKPPESYNEISRLDAVSKYINLPHWKHTQFFTKATTKLKKNFKVCGVSISLIDNYKCHFKVETLLDTSSVPRCVAIDSHAILSNGYFVLLDASQDWRTSSNPLVTGAPYIKFYCGVPLAAKNNEIIGILAIFDKKPRNSFGDEARKALKVVSEEIMDWLNTPLDTIHRPKYFDHVSDSFLPYGNKDKKKALLELKNEIGRPTSGRSSLIFEKDGSGGPYNQNQNFRFIKFDKGDKVDPAMTSHSRCSPKLPLQSQSPPSQLTDKELWQFLFSVGTLKKAATALAKILATTYKFDFVYILEIRVAEPCCIVKEFFPANEEKIDFESFAYSTKVTKSKDLQDEFMTREIGAYLAKSNNITEQQQSSSQQQQQQQQPAGSNGTTMNRFFENSIHYKAFISEFGLEIKNPKANTVYNHGLLMPFFRHDAKLVRRNATVSAKDSKKNVVDLYLRSGGFLIALFSEKTREFDVDLVSEIFNHSCIFRKIYIATQ
ncbi:hypothetical protein KGF56_000797 [Candida oxycetoniae]|uniref:GAF domain-containing protein n=1 Tax=Candida oxycetoniae TaxID=497107 RepID=A0AAI9T0T1_9ASCO|nr:uncharacterized protein KGF56_000797 [Candida oxycetoniae]KAI3406317.2 hypothetical protein KGF56_000797 [Candida oxycetoniae]